MAIGFFTHGVAFTLPHPPIPERTILLLCNVIKTAWRLLMDNPPDGFFLHSADEDTITQVMVEIIENRLRKTGEVNGFDRERFGMVIREPKKTNVDKNHPDKMPDIFFDLKRDQYSILSEQDGLFIECKPIDEKHPSLSCYCKKGIVRFVNGNYAWAMQDAMMVGYVTGTYSFKKLASVLNDGKSSAGMKTTGHSSVDDYGIYRSSHQRKFNWPEGYGQACPIFVSHLWLFI